MRNTLIVLLALSASNIGYASSFKDHHKDAIHAIKMAASIAKVPEKLLMSICWHESNFRKTGVTHMDGGSLSYGICQIKMDTAKAMARLYKYSRPSHSFLENTSGNALFAALYLKHQLYLYDNNWRLAADAYNKGNAVSANSRYVNHVIEGMEFLNERLK